MSSSFRQRPTVHAYATPILMVFRLIYWGWGAGQPPHPPQRQLFLSAKIQAASSPCIASATTIHVKTS